MCKGIISPTSKKLFIEVIKGAIEVGVEGVILGCTEIGLLIKQTDIDVPVFDTTEIHARQAVELSLI